MKTERKSRQWFMVPLTLLTVIGLPIWAFMTGNVMVGNFASVVIFLYGAILAYTSLGILLGYVGFKDLPKSEQVATLKVFVNVNWIRRVELIGWAIIGVTLVATGGHWSSVRRWVVSDLLYHSDRGREVHL